MKKYIFAAMLALCGASAEADSVRVVKGQVSDYYIPVSRSRIVEGTVADADGKPLEGATVMWFASPIHAQTDANGRFRIKGEPHERRLYVWYPGMKFADMTIGLDDLDVDVTMQPDSRDKVQRRRKGTTPTIMLLPHSAIRSTYPTISSLTTPTRRPEAPSARRPTPWP